MGHVGAECYNEAMLCHVALDRQALRMRVLETFKRFGGSRTLSVRVPRKEVVCGRTLRDQAMTSGISASLRGVVACVCRMPVMSLLIRYPGICRNRKRGTKQKTRVS